MDSETRMLLATHISRGRSLAETRAPFRKAKAVTETRPTEVYSDGMMSYPKAIRRELGTRTKNPHVLVESIRAETNNNKIERLHGSEKSRTKVMRAFDRETGAAALMDGWRVHYDMVRTHQTLGKTPAEAADIPPLVGFKWHELLKLASTRKYTARNVRRKTPDG